MSKTAKRKRSSLTESFIAHSREMRRSAAWRHLPDNARRVLDRLELEHMEHGGAENGFLRVTYSDFEAGGLRRASVSLAIRQCVALGFLEVAQQGGRSISDQRWPSQYRLTYVPGCGRSIDPTHDWRRVTEENVRDLLAKAAAEKNISTQFRIRKAGRENAPEPDAEMRLNWGVAGRAIAPR